LPKEKAMPFDERGDEESPAAEMDPLLESLARLTSDELASCAPHLMLRESMTAVLRG
jgi:hypothetical protein